VGGVHRQDPPGHGSLDRNFVYPEEAPLWRITPATYGRIAEALRPVDADFASAGPSA
jgi:hypothetical protein